ncbi:hypothetical protein MCAP1_002852 [Malassezia caprae]|uniref:Uncharacterized protein n=1 Tax=Malassezia caprae TaxID=1381934 RepID=A0AAF0J128_9BASI|nr:hypothetical protein MCAP1_002852 [Malassezia caprae]
MSFQAAKAQRLARERGRVAAQPDAPAGPIHALQDTPLEIASSSTHGRGLCIAAGTGGVAAGTTLVALEAVSVLNTTQLGVRCHYCYARREQGLLRCSRCRFARYCDATCQAAGWKIARHRDECEALQRWYAGADALPDLDRDPGPSVRVLAQLLWLRRRRGPAWWAPFAAMQSHRQDASAVQKDEAAQIAVRLAKFIGAEAGLRTLGIDSAKALLELVCQYQTNAFTLTDAQLDPIGAALEPTVALLNHSCTPNAVVVFSSATEHTRCPIEVVALRDLTEGEPVYTSYVDLAAPLPVRQQTLQERYHFTCACRLCTRSRWVDPRTARWCARPGCHGWVAPAARPCCRQCRAGETDTEAKEALVAEALELVPKIHRGMHTQLDESLVVQLRAMLPRISAVVPPSHYAMWTLVHAAHVLAIERCDWDEATQLTMLLCAGMQARGARDEPSTLYPAGHPQRAVLLATLGRLLLQEAPSTPSPLLARTVPMPTTPEARARLAHTVLRQALTEAERGFGSRTRGGWVAESVRASLRNVEQACA